MKVMFRAFILVLIALCGFLAFAGYFDRDVLVNIPATAKPAQARSHLAAVYFSGDVGYRVAMGQMIGSRLAADGIPVVAVNSLGYFRQHRSVAEVTALTSVAIRRALAFGHANQVILVGHSLGADALQAGLVHLPQELRSKVRAVVLIVPTDALYLQVSPGEMLDWSKPEAEVLPTLRQLTWTPVTCIFGKKESDSPCRQLTVPNVRHAPLPGGHALDWNINAIHALILKAVDAGTDANITKDSESDNQTAMPIEARKGHSQTC